MSAFTEALRGLSDAQLQANLEHAEAAFIAECDMHRVIRAEIARRSLAGRIEDLHRRIAAAHYGHSSESIAALVDELNRLQSPEYFAQ
jgi:hypothetical protein